VLAKCCLLKSSGILDSHQAMGGFEMFFALYVLCQFFSNFGANSTTFIGKQHFGIGCAAK